jgi:hypothetical protein
MDIINMTIDKINMSMDEINMVAVFTLFSMSFSYTVILIN